jgi:hypothetical protein
VATAVALARLSRMDNTRIFQAEQIVIAPELAGILKDYAKAMIRAHPQSKQALYRSSYEYFDKRVEAQGGERGPAAK